MTAELLKALAMATLASSAALLIIGVLRKPLRALAGARAACWLWLLMPATTLAVLLPAPSQLLMPPAAALPAQIEAVLIVAVDAPGSDRAPWLFGALVLWLAGAAGMFSFLLARQRAFMRSLGQLTIDADGLHRSGTASAPLLIGLWQPRIVVPVDFEDRYLPEERVLILAHERAHAARHDLAINAFASAALCVFWFNPLAYRALAWLRVDQELACDALVLSGRSDMPSEKRRAYADALLKTQLATESAWRAIGCRWQSNYPLKERILMIKRPLPGVSRRLAGFALVLGLTAATGYAAWAGQAVSDGKGPPVILELKLTITDSKSNEVRALATRYLVHSGEEMLGEGSHPLEFACTPYLPDDAGGNTDWSAIRARGLPLPQAGQILVLCSIRERGRVISSPAVIMGDGKWGTIETAGEGGTRLYRLEVNASTSEARIAEAKEQASKG